MSYIKEANSPYSPLSSYSKTLINEDDENTSNFNFSICSEPVNRKKMVSSINSLTGRKNSLMINDFVIKPEKDWINTAFCMICSVNFDKFKGVFTHHCRMCGMSACGLCSSKKINSQRVCDLCFLRIESQAIIEGKEKMLEMKEDTCRDLEKTIEDFKDKINLTSQNIASHLLQSKEEEKKRSDAIEQMKQELKDTATNLKRKKENQQNFYDNLKNEETLLMIKEQEFEKLRKNNAKLKEEILRKKFHLNHGREELAEMIEQIHKTQTTQSYLDLTDVFDISKEDLQRTFTQIEFHNKSDHSMLENCDVDIKNLLKKTISYQNRTYTTNSLLKMKEKMDRIPEGCNVELENEEKVGPRVDFELRPRDTGNCFGNAKCKIF